MVLPFAFDSERWIHSIKTAFACLLGVILTDIVHIQIGQWLVITILVVMCAQVNVGSVLQKSYMRFVGTCTGSLIALLVLECFGGQNTIAIAAALTLSAILFSFIATSNKSYSDSGTLGVVTIAIILMGNNPTPINAVERFFEISLGILIATLVSQFVLPIHARTHLRKNQANTLRQLKQFYTTSLIKPSDQQDVKRLNILEEKIIKSLIAQRKLSAEAAREPFGAAFQAAYFTQSLWCERETLRCMVFMSQTIASSSTVRDLLATLPTVTEFHQTLSTALDRIAICIEQQKMEPIALPSTEPLKLAIQQALAAMSFADHIPADTFIFCADTLIARLQQLVNLLTEMDASGSFVPGELI